MLINNSMFDFSLSNSNGGSRFNHLTQGAAVRVGPKFLLGQDYYMKGMKYAHPMKGRYFKPEVIFTGFTVRGLKKTIYNPYPTPPTDVYSDLRVGAISLMLNYGRQFILGNSMTVAYSIGGGYAITSAKYTNPDYEKAISRQYYYYRDERNSYTQNLFSHLRIGNSPFIISTTVTLGYVFK
jgi:hypothetical protein